MTRFLICDDHALIRDALVSSIRRSWPDAGIALAADFPGSWALAGDDIDVCICDLAMPGAGPAEGITRLMEIGRKMRLVVISGGGCDRTAEIVLALGVHGLFFKTMAPELLETVVRVVLAGGTFIPPGFSPTARSTATTTTISAVPRVLLTSQQICVMKAICQGKTNKEIAKELGIAPSTVNYHVDSLLTRLSARNRAEAIQIFLSSPH